MLFELDHTVIHYSEYLKYAQMFKENAFSESYFTLQGDVSKLTYMLMRVTYFAYLGAKSVTKYLGGSILDKPGKGSKKDVVQIVEAPLQRDAANFLVDVLVSDDHLYLPKDLAGKYILKGEFYTSWLRGADLSLESKEINVIGRARRMKQLLLDMIFSVDRLERIQNIEWALSDRAEEEQFGVQKIIHIFNNGIMGEVANMKVEWLADGQMRTDDFKCEPQMVKGLKSITSKFKTISTERRWIQAVWIKKLIELAGHGIVADDLCYSSMCYKSASLYARTSISTLKLLDLQFDCLLSHLVSKTESMNELMTSDTYIHLTVLRSMISNGWWNPPK